MRIDQIKAFVRCAELGGVSSAARAEQVPKSTLSRLLRELEDGLRVRLIERSTRGVALTDEGRAFLPHARRVLEEIDLAAAAATGFRAGPSGVVRMTAPYTFGVTFVAPLLPAFMRLHPGISVHLDLTSRVVDLTPEGYDLAIRIGPAPSSLISRRLTGNPMALCATPAYLRENGEPATPGDLARHPLLLIGGSRSHAALRLTRGQAIAVVSQPPRLLSSDPAVILQATQAGAGIGQAPLILAAGKLRDGELTAVLSDWRMAEADICLLFPRGRAAAPRVRLLADHLSANLRAPGRAFSGTVGDALHSGAWKRKELANEQQQPQAGPA